MSCKNLDRIQLTSSDHFAASMARDTHLGIRHENSFAFSLNQTPIIVFYDNALNSRVGGVGIFVFLMLGLPGDSTALELPGVIR